MTNYSLDIVSVSALSGNEPKNAVILCHGYGGDGKDISVLANNWRRFLPNTIFLCPNAPEICADNPQGYQWFDLISDNEDEILEKSLTDLDDEFKNIIILRDIQELSYDEISKILKIPLGTVKSRINRGRFKLKDLLKQKGVVLY